jgi:hypothetical protein
VQAEHLDQLATRTEAAWQEVADLIETKKPRDCLLDSSWGWFMRGQDRINVTNCVTVKL